MMNNQPNNGGIPGHPGMAPPGHPGMAPPGHPGMAPPTMAPPAPPGNGYNNQYAQQQQQYPPQQQQYQQQFPPQQQQQFPPPQQQQQFPPPQQQQFPPQQQPQYAPPPQQQPQYPPVPQQLPRQQQPPPRNNNNNNNNQNANPQPLGNRLARPPYMDPTTHIVYDTDQAEYEGWLTKQSVWLKDWRRRYFILKGNKLFFAKNEYQGPHGMIDLAHCTTVKSADWKSKKRHSFEISTPEITYLLYADTESEKDDWIGRVGKAIVRCSRTYVGQGGSQQQQQQHSQNNNSPYGNNPYQEDDDDDDIYTNDDPDNPYFND